MIFILFIICSNSVFTKLVSAVSTLIFGCVLFALRLPHEARKYYLHKFLRISVFRPSMPVLAARIIIVKKMVMMIPAVSFIFALYGVLQWHGKNIRLDTIPQLLRLLRAPVHSLFVNAIKC